MAEGKQPIIFDEEACANFIFKKLIERGISVTIDDIRVVMDLEFEYGQSIGIYPPDNEGEAPVESRIMLSIVEVSGKPELHSEVEPEKAVALLQEALDDTKKYL